MGFTATYGNGPEGPQTPLQLHGDFLEKRRPLKIFKTVRVNEGNTGNSAEDGSSNIPEKELIGSFDELSNDSGTGSIIDSRIEAMNGTFNGTSSGTVNETQEADEKGAADKIMEKVRDNGRAGSERDSPQTLEASEAIAEVESDVRSLLLQIQAKEFATMVYE